MRVKVRFDAESSQAPVVLDLRFLPRVGERLEIGFRRVIEVMDVCRIDSDSRFSGIIRARLLRVERRGPPPPPTTYQPMGLPLPDWSLPSKSLAVTPAPAPAPAVPPIPAPALASAEQPNYGDVNFADLTAALRQAEAAALQNL